LNTQTEEVPPDTSPVSSILLKEVLDMKALLITTLVMGFISVNAASAAQEINHADGKEKIGVVSASNAYTLDELSMRSLVRLMSKEQSFKILSTTGNNRLHGVAEIYK
jgi:multiple stress resistance protein BhsA